MLGVEIPSSDSHLDPTSNIFFLLLALGENTYFRGMYFSQFLNYSDW